MPKITDFDFVYISYDEPNAEENYQDLLDKVSSTKRVHNIKGFDAAHHMAADIAETNNFFVIDGDNQIVREFFLETIPDDFNPAYVYSWSARNIINNLIYGNGGIKLWSKQVLKNSHCHESNGITGIDWCWTVPYYQMNDWFSYSLCNASPYQAFRAGFREGIKMTLDGNGQRVLRKIDHIANSNKYRLIAWMTLGADITNGIYAIYGARLGFLKAICEDHFDISLVSDYDWIENYYNTELHYLENGDYWQHYQQMAIDIEKICGLYVANFNAEQSRAAKQLLSNPLRKGLMKPELGLEEYLIKNNFISKER